MPQLVSGLPVTMGRESAWHLAIASTTLETWPSPAPGPCQLKCGQTPMSQALGLPCPQGWGGSWSSLSKDKSQVPHWSGLGREGKCPHLVLSPAKPRTTQRLSRRQASQLPRILPQVRVQSESSLDAVWTPEGGLEGWSCSQAGWMWAMTWGRAVPLSQGTHPL